MKVNRIVVGELETNCYVLEKNNNVLIIDPGDEYVKIEKFVKNKNVVGILLTHSHFDHVGCVEDFVNNYGVDVFDSKSLDEGNNVIANFRFEVIRTYGHTMDSISFYFADDKVMFTGDFLFYDTIGRCDFVDSNVEEMKRSIIRIKEFSDDIVIYPGHGCETNLGREKEFNSYFN